MKTARDSMGEMHLPDEALWGASTQRALLNFAVSGHTVPKRFIRTLGSVKAAAARANLELGRLGDRKSQLIQKAAREIAAGLHADQFPLDIFQSGSGTSINMNVNEVIATLAQSCSRSEGENERIHPNDDVNLGQSSNDVIPSVLHVSVALLLNDDLAPALQTLSEAWELKAAEFADCVKVGRTHLMDATPITLGQEFSGYATQGRKAVERVNRAIHVLGELAIGGTAVGTGLNTHPDFAHRVCRILSDDTGVPFREARNHFEAQGARDDAVEVAGQLCAIAGGLSKMANDVRLLSSGPRAGLSELKLPPTQPGSSIMPGKVNPVMCEMLIQVALYVQGLSAIVGSCGRDGQLELNATLPLIAYCLHESVSCLANATRIFADKCVKGIEVNLDRCREYVSRSLMTVTALNPYIGYDTGAEVAKEAYASGKTIREIVISKGLLGAEELDRILDPCSMIGPIKGNGEAPIGR